MAEWSVVAPIRFCPLINYIYAAILYVYICIYIRGGWGSICNETPFINPSINALGFYAICQTKDQSVAVIMVIMVHETLFYHSKFNKLQTFIKHTNIHCLYFPPNCKDSF